MSLLLVFFEALPCSNIILSAFQMHLMKRHDPWDSVRTAAKAPFEADDGEEVVVADLFPHTNEMVESESKSLDSR